MGRMLVMLLKSQRTQAAYLRKSKTKKQVQDLGFTCLRLLLKNTVGGHLVVPNTEGGAKLVISLPTDPDSSKRGLRTPK